MRFLLLAAFVLATFSLFSTSCISIDLNGSIQSPGRVNHVVLCWLKNPRDTATRDEIIRVSKTFKSIPGVTKVRAGIALPSERGIVDDSFHIGIVVTCRDAAALQTYLDHPTHTEAAEALIRPAARRVVVYDIVE
jgi:hypothetical protein